MKGIIRFINRCLDILFSPIKKLLNRERSHITSDVNRILNEMSYDKENEYDSLMFFSRIKIKEYYETQELHTKDIVLRKKEIEGLLDKKFSIVISGVIGVLVGTFMPENLLVITSEDINIVIFIVRIIIFAFLLVFVTTKFVESIYTLSEYEQRDLTEFELRIINDILKKRREDKEKEYLITE